MTATALQAWVAVVGALLASGLGILKYFNYRSRRDRVSLVGQAFNSTVEGLSSDAETKKLAAAILLRRFFDEETEQGEAGTPYKSEAVAVIAALLRNSQTGELQKLLADGLAFASSLEGADLQQCNLSGAYLGQRPRATVAHGAARLFSARRKARSARGRGRGGRSVDPTVTAPIDLTEADLFGANLTGASLRSGIAKSAVFYTAIAQGAVFEEADLEGADFRQADLKEARFAGAHLERADFRQADLQGAKFAGAWIKEATFAGVHHLPADVASLLDPSGQVRAGEGMPVRSI